MVGYRLPAWALAWVSWGRVRCFRLPYPFLSPTDRGVERGGTPHGEAPPPRVEFPAEDAAQCLAGRLVECGSWSPGEAVGGTGSELREVRG